MIDERDVREMLERRAEAISGTPTDEPDAIRRARRRLGRNAAVAGLIALAVVAGGFAWLRTIQAPPAIPANPAPAPSRAKLAYALDGDIFVADSDGSNAVRIADGRSAGECGGNGEYWAEGPMWSPDGRYLAYRRERCPVRSEEDPSGIVISEAEGNLVTEVPSTQFDPNLESRGISWSPDSTRFATWVTFVDVPAPDGTPVPVGATIGVFGLDGEREALLRMRPFTEFGSGGDLMWGPDGESLLVGDVVVPIDGSTPYLLRFEGVGWRPDFLYSPDGSRLAYVHELDAPPGNRLIVADADGSNAEVVFVGGIPQNGFVWSPAGDRIAFTTRPPDTLYWSELRVVDLDTGTVTLLADWSDREAEYQFILSALDFSPEGDRVLFRALDGEGSLWSVNVDGSGLRRVVGGTSLGDWSE